MKPFSMNLSKFKKIAQDAKSSTLQHLDGHKIMVLHSALPQHMRKQLEGLPMYQGGVAHYEGGSDKTVSEADAAPAEKPVDVNVNVAPPQPAQAPQPNTPSANLIAGQQPVDVKVNQPPQNAGLIDENQQTNAVGAVSREQQALREQAAIDSAKGAQVANVERGYQDALKARALQDIQEAEQMKAHVDEFAKYDAANPINPSHYQENMGAAQKVTTALGLIAGGISSGVNGGPNPAMQFLNQQIDRDIDSQKQNWQNKKSVFGAYMSKYGDERVASAMTKASMLDIYMNRLRQVTAQVGTPQAIQNLHMAEAKAAIEKTQYLREAQAVKGTFGDQTLTQAPAQPAGAQPKNNPEVAAASPEGLGDLLGKPFGDSGQTSSADEKEGVDKKSKEHQEELSKNLYRLVTPDAQKKIGMMQYTNLPSDKQDYEGAQKQLRAAQQAEKVLNGVSGDGVGGLHDLMQRMYTNIGQGGPSGGGIHLREHGREALESIPYVGQAAGAAMDVIPKSQAYKQYESEKAGLIKAMSAALQGLVAPTDIEKLIKPNLPAYGDKPEDIRFKEKQIAEGITRALSTDLLEKKGVLNKRH